MRVRSALGSMLLAATSALLWGCATEPNAVESVSVAPAFVFFATPRAPAELVTVTVTGSDGRRLTDVPVTWGHMNGPFPMPGNQLESFSRVVTVERVDNATWRVQPIGEVGGGFMYALAGGKRGGPVGYGVYSGPPAELAITRQPTDATSGLPLRLVVVEKRDADKNPTSRTLAVTASIAFGNGSLSGTVTVVSSSTELEFRNLIIEGSGVFSLLFSAPGVTPVETLPFVVAAR